MSPSSFSDGPATRASSPSGVPLFRPRAVSEGLLFLRSLRERNVHHHELLRLAGRARSEPQLDDFLMVAGQFSLGESDNLLSLGRHIRQAEQDGLQVADLSSVEKRGVSELEGT